MKQKQTKWILASASPRRKKLLEDAGFQIEIQVPLVEEVIDKTWSPETCVCKLAFQKAQDVVCRLNKNGNYSKTDCVIAADTIVVLGDKILGKPKDEEDAYQMLWHLSRNRHRVITGVCIWFLDWQNGITNYDVTHVQMRQMTYQEIMSYIHSGESMGKAGAYAIQETADRYVVKLEGAFDNVVGLPIELVKKMLSSVGI